MGRVDLVDRVGPHGVRFWGTLVLFKGFLLWLLAAGFEGERACCLHGGWCLSFHWRVGFSLCLVTGFWEVDSGGVGEGGKVDL